MDVNATNNHINLAVNYKNALSSLFSDASGSSSSETVADVLQPETDLASTGALAQLKSNVAGAKEIGREEYINSIKEAVDNGSFSIDSDTLADVMIEDGFLEFLTM